MAVTVKFYVKVTAVTGTPLIRCHYVNGSSSEGTNWGTAIEGNETDFASTSEFEAESDVEVTGTGWISFTLDYANIDKDSTLYVRLNDLNYLNQNTETITFASTNNATAGDRPYLEITVTSDAQYVHTWTCTC